MTMNQDQAFEEGTVIDLPGTTIEVLDDRFVRATGKAQPQELADARAVVDVIKAIRASWGQDIRLVVDMRQVRALSREARLLYQSEEYAAALVGCALLVDSGLSRVIGNFAIGLNKGHVVVRLFTDEGEARVWLRSLSDD